MGRHTRPGIAPPQYRNDFPGLADNGLGACRSPLRIRVGRRLSRITVAACAAALLGGSSTVLTRHEPIHCPAVGFEMIWPQQVGCIQFHYGHLSLIPTNGVPRVRLT